MRKSAHIGARCRIRCAPPHCVSQPGMHQWRRPSETRTHAPLSAPFLCLHGRLLQNCRVVRVEKLQPAGSLASSVPVPVDISEDAGVAPCCSSLQALSRLAICAGPKSMRLTPDCSAGSGPSASDLYRLPWPEHSVALTHGWAASAQCNLSLLWWARKPVLSTHTPGVSVRSSSTLPASLPSTHPLRSTYLSPLSTSY